MDDEDRRLDNPLRGRTTGTEPAASPLTPRSGTSVRSTSAARTAASGCSAEASVLPAVSRTTICSAWAPFCTSMVALPLQPLLSAVSSYSPSDTAHTMAGWARPIRKHARCIRQHRFMGEARSISFLSACK